MNAFGNTLAALSFISFVLLIPAMSWHCKCKNIPAASLIFWLMFDNLTNFINACIWSGDNFYEVYDGKGYCDVTLKLLSGSSSGKVACISALTMNLYFVLAAKNIALIDNKSKKKLAANIVICWFLPIFVMCTNYLIQVVRYSIFRYKGCANIYVDSVATIMLYSIWPFLWSIVGLIFACLTTFQYFKFRKDVKDILRCTNTGLDIKRFARLLIFSFLVICACFPLATIYFVRDLKNELQPYSFAEIHSEDWGVITFWDFDREGAYTTWITVALSVVTFLLFGIGSDAIEMYKRFFAKLGFNQFSKSLTNNQTFQLSKEYSGLSKSTRYDSNISSSAKSKSTFGEETFVHSPVNLENEQNSPFTLVSKQSDIKFSTEPVDIEKGSTSLEEELGYIDASFNDLSDVGFDYNYQVKQNR